MSNLEDESQNMNANIEEKLVSKEVANLDVNKEEPEEVNEERPDGEEKVYNDNNQGEEGNKEIINDEIENANPEENKNLNNQEYNDTNIEQNNSVTLNESKPVDDKKEVKNVINDDKNITEKQNLNSQDNQEKFYDNLRTVIKTQENILTMTTMAKEKIKYANEISVDHLKSFKDNSMKYGKYLKLIHEELQMISDLTKKIKKEYK